MHSFFSPENTFIGHQVLTKQNHGAHSPGHLEDKKVMDDSNVTSLRQI